METLQPGSEEWEDTREALFSVAKTIREEFDLNEVQYKNLLLLFGGVQVGHSPSRISRLTGLAEGFIRRRVKKLRDTGIWGDDGKTHCEWFEEHGEIALVCDVLVLDGTLNRTMPEPEKPPEKLSIPQVRGGTLMF